MKYHQRQKNINTMNRLKLQVISHKIIRPIKKVDKLIIASIAEFALIMAMVVFILLDNMPSLLVDHRFIFLIIAFCILYVGLAIVIIIEIMRLSK
jgi:hypothetical protein